MPSRPTGGPSEPRRRRTALLPLEVVSTFERPLSIAMIAPCAFPTHHGTQVLIRHLATALAQAGHEVHLITYGYGEYEADFRFHLHRAGRVQGGLRAAPGLLRPAADAALLVTAGRVIRAHGCDLLHVHNVEGLGVGALLKLQTSLPLVYHAHNAMGPELPTYFRAHLAQAFASVVGDVIDRTLPRIADAVITFDPDHKFLHEVYGIDEARLHVIPPGLDATEITALNPERLKQVAQQLGPGPWLLYAGNADGYQNLPLLWQAFARVRAERPDVRLLVASSEPESTFTESLAAAPSRDGITFHRYEDNEELNALFALASLGVSPRSLWIGAPIKVLNYLAAGLPTVAVRSGCRHLLTDETAATSAMVDDDPDQFAQACLRFLDDPPRGSARSRRSLERFRIENHVPLYEAVYRSVLAPRTVPAEV